MIKRSFRFLFLWIAVLATVLSSVPAVSATPTDHPNTYKNTGDMRADLIGVALTQVGYYEGPNNDTKYGEWYGYNNLGWCGMFVTWCAEQAGIPTSIIPKTGTSNPADYNVTCYSGKEYRPQTGDLFFRKSGSSYAHVGIVYYLDGDNFYTIEGNTYWQGPEGVYIRCRKIADYDFGVVNYPDTTQHSYQAGYEASHPHKEYKKCSHCGDKYYTGSTKTSPDCQECKKANCTHSYTGWTTTGSSKHTRSCSKCGKTETANHSWNSGSVTKQPTCGKSGEKVRTCTVCSATRSESIAQLTKHDFGAWEFLSDEKHTRSCASCGKTETVAHTEDAAWNSDDLSHWHACSDCEVRLHEQAHSFGAECNSPCQLCGFLREEGHSYETDWTIDDNGHRKVCSVCQSETPLEDHIFDNNCDDTCNTCGYTRQAGHTFAEQYMSDGNGHWKTCTQCHTKTDIQPHIPGPAATEDHPQTCTVCQKMLSPVKVHTHDFKVSTTTAQYHISTCSCGEQTGNVLHTWDPLTDRCSTCNAVRPSSTVTTILFAAIPAMALVSLFPLLIRSIRRRFC